MVLNLAFWVVVIPALLKMMKNAEDAFGPETGAEKKNSVMNIFQTFFESIPGVFGVSAGTLPAWSSISGLISDAIDIFTSILNFFGIFKKAPAAPSGFIRLRTVLLLLVMALLLILAGSAFAFVTDGYYNVIQPTSYSMQVNNPNVTIMDGTGNTYACTIEQGLLTTSEIDCPDVGASIGINFDGTIVGINPDGTAVDTGLKIEQTAPPYNKCDGLSPRPACCDTPVGCPQK